MSGLYFAYICQCTLCNIYEQRTLLMSGSGLSPSLADAQATAAAAVPDRVRLGIELRLDWHVINQSLPEYGTVTASATLSSTQCGMAP